MESSMISQDEVERALHFLAESAVEFAKAKARRVWMEGKVKIVRSKLFIRARSSDVTVAQAEAMSYADTEYQAVMDELRDAVEAEETIRCYREAAEARIMLWRTLESTRRAENIR